jgi:Flp pilus assembly protein TadG
LARRFGCDERGVSAVEFAFIAPLLILFYFGMAETCQLLMAKRRISHAGAAVADLVSQGKGPALKADLDDKLLAAQSIVYPFPTTSLRIQLTSVRARNPTAGGDPMVDWSYPAGGRAKDSTFAVGTPLNPGESVIVAEVTYSYNSSIGYFIPAAKALTYKAEYRPRREDYITCTDCP